MKIFEMLVDEAAGLERKRIKAKLFGELAGKKRLDKSGCVFGLGEGRSKEAIVRVLGRLVKGVIGLGAGRMGIV